MSKVLVTGGIGGLGSEIVPRLLAADHKVRIMSRSAKSGSGNTEWAQADLAEGTGIAEAVQGVDAIIHAATFPMGSKVDVEGTKLLLRHAREAGVNHFVYISIVGIDNMTEFSYYRNKLAAEQHIESGGVPWTILRATQFHGFIDLILQQLTRLPVALIPKKWQFQSMSAGEAAEQLVAAMEGGPSGRVPDIGGPEVLRMGDMARAWLAAQGKQRPMINFPVRFGPGKGWRAGLNLTPDNRVGKITWADWLAARYGGANKIKFQQRTEENRA